MSNGLRPGEAIWMRFPYSEPPKNKLCLCVCVEDNIFLLVNSKAFRAAPADSQIALFTEDLSCLVHKSFLDVSKSYDDFPIKEIERGINRGVYSLVISARNRIKHAVGGQPYLAERVKKKILSNL